MTKLKHETQPYVDKGKKLEHHFFASSFMEWRTNKDPAALMRQMDNLGENYSLYYVPLPEDASYKINFFVPQVDGVLFLARYVAK